MKQSRAVFSRFRHGAVASAVVVALTGFASPVLARNFIVNTPNDTQDSRLGDGECRDSYRRCSLRAAIEETNTTPDAFHVIDLGAETYTLSRGELVVSGNQIIRGVSAAQSIIRRGSALLRPFRVNTNGQVDFMTLTIRDGNPSDPSTLNVGGGLFVERGQARLFTVKVMNNVGVAGGGIAVNVGASLVLQRVEVSGNKTSLQPTSMGINWTGGGLSIATGATAFITASTFSNNEGQIGGGIYSAGYMQLTNSTLSGNVSRSSGGGIFQESADSLSFVRFTTITNNTCNKGASLFSNQGGGISLQSGSLQIGSSIIAGNRDGRDWDFPQFAPDCDTHSSGGIFSWGFNLLGNIGTSCFFDSWTDDQIGSGNSATTINPQLSALANNGGSTMTHLPSSTSPAVDSNFNTEAWFSCQAISNFDQRDLNRPTDGNGDGSAVCDRGAVER